MLRKKIGMLLKKRRKELQLTVNEVADKLLDFEIFIAAKSIYNWEAGTRQPDADTFLYLCDIYQIKNVLEYFNMDDSTLNTGDYTPNEQTHIKKYRALDERGKQTVDTVLNSQYELIEAKKETTCGLSDEEIEKELESYKQELLAEQKGKTLSASTGTNGVKKEIG